MSHSSKPVLCIITTTAGYIGNASLRRIRSIKPTQPTMIPMWVNIIQNIVTLHKVTNFFLFINMFDLPTLKYQQPAKLINVAH